MGEPMTSAKTTRRTDPASAPSPLRSYVAAVESCLDRFPATPVLIKEISALTKELVRDGSWISADERRPSAENYARHLLHRDLKNRFVVLSVVWLPGQGTPIHDHGCWGVM